MKIYIASSWKNVDLVRALADHLRSRGHLVYDFTDGENRPDGLGTFVFNASELLGMDRSKIDWLEFLEHPATKKAFKNDKAGIDWADLLILINPSGRSSHLEAGYAAGKGKRVLVYGDLPPGEFDVMYLLAGGHYRLGDHDGLLAGIGGASK